MSWRKPLIWQKPLGGMTLRHLVVKTWREANEDNIFGAAAEFAYYLLLSLFPLLIFLTSLVGSIPNARHSLTFLLTQDMPREATHLVRDTVKDIVRHSSGGLISFGVLGTLFSASSGMAALMNTLNVAFEVKEHRSYWKVRLIAVGLTVGLSLLITEGAVLIVFGNKISSIAAELLELGTISASLGAAIDYLAGVLLLLLGIEVIYHFAPDKKQSWRWLTPGGLFAVGGFLAGSFLFSLYLRLAPNYSAIYGALGAVIVLMIWLYMICLLVLLGAQIDSEIAKASQFEHQHETAAELRE